MTFSKEERKRRATIAQKKYYYANRVLKPKLTEEERRAKYLATRKRGYLKNKLTNSKAYVKMKEYKKQYYLNNREKMINNSLKTYYNKKAKLRNISGETYTPSHKVFRKRVKKVKKEIPKVSIQTNIILTWD